jgi:hypothetical protein
VSRSSRTLEFVLEHSGETQHILTRPGDDGWLYKIPAFLEQLRQQPFRVADAVPYRLLRWLPRQLREQPPVSSAGLVRAIWRLRTRRAFARSLAALHQLRVESNAQLVLPFTTTSVTLVAVAVGQEEHLYSGPMLRQKRADVFFDRVAHAVHLDWSPIVHAQLAMWQVGVAIADTSAAVTPFNWALLDGVLLLGDTGALTRSHTHGRDVLHRAHVDAYRAYTLERTPIADRALMSERLVWSCERVTPDELSRRWPR